MHNVSGKEDMFCHFFWKFGLAQNYGQAKVWLMKIGILSDTHGRLPAKALDVLKEADAIFHAGDIGSLSVIEALETIGPVHAVSGNMDGNEIRRRFPRKDVIEIDKYCFYLIHEPHLLDIDPATAGVHCVIFGHTHVPFKEERDGVLFINPGSVSLPGYRNPPTLALCSLDLHGIKAEIVSL